MRCPTKVQLIQRKNSRQWYVNFPADIARVMDFTKGEEFEWTLVNQHCLLLGRKATAPQPGTLKKRPAAERARRAPGQGPGTL